MPEAINDDLAHMRHALRLAARGLGRVAPNPSVGCVVVSREGRIVGRGWTGIGGRPHAETIALEQAGEAARGATAYVSLEPCAHHGKTPPCADALIAAGVARVVSTVRDPDPRVSGRGFARLRDAGVAVTEDVLADEAAFLNEGFFKRVTQGRPLIALKIAQSADGYVTGAPGSGKWITGARARAHGHLLRAQHDAILIGSGTALADDPELTCRLPGMADRSPLRIVLDSKLRLPSTSKLARTARTVPVLVFTTERGGGKKLEALGVEIVRCKQDKDLWLDIRQVLWFLAARGITRVLAEGGPTIHMNLIQEGLVDRLHVYQSPSVLGGGKHSAIAPLPLQRLAGYRRLELVERAAFGPDVLESYAVRV